ncbi:2-hydroxyacid dehydrogenase [Psychrobacillus sp. NPDC093180]|uniref:2-hydroxyacid dehydrogenase n=1 Tax=Psychrobacillus sp. NPDC093180 TaxID=3364489 RepID=UPI00382D1A6F
MIKKRVLMLDKVSEKMEVLCRKYLSKDAEIFFCNNDISRENHLTSSEVLVTFTNGVSASWIRKAEKCVFIQKLGAGVNNIDIEEASQKKIMVANTTGLNATSVAEHSVMLMVSSLKHLVTAHNNIVNDDRWLKTDLRDQSYELSYKKVGLIGFGNIGKEVRRLLKGYECKVFYFDAIRLSEEMENKLDITYMELEQLIQESDVVSLHVPLTNDTHHLINEERLRRMKKTAVIVNTCRGGVIDETALYEVLKSGHLTGAGLDVFETEPITKRNKLANLPNVIMTPHIGGGTNEAMEAVLKSAFENINSILTTGKVANINSVVNLKEMQSYLA